VQKIVEISLKFYGIHAALRFLLSNAQEFRVRLPKSNFIILTFAAIEILQEFPAAEKFQKHKR